MPFSGQILRNLLSNELGVVQEAAKNLRDRACRISQRLNNSGSHGWWIGTGCLGFCLLIPFMFIILLFTVGPCCLIFLRSSSRLRIQAISPGQIRPILLLETLAARIENQHYRPWTFFLPDHKPPDPQLPARKSLMNIDNASITSFIYSLGSGMKKLQETPWPGTKNSHSRSSPPFYMRPKGHFPPKKEWTFRLITFSFWQIPVSGRSQEFPCPRLLKITNQKIIMRKNRPPLVIYLHIFDMFSISSKG